METATQGARATEVCPMSVNNWKESGSKSLLSRSLATLQELGAQAHWHYAPSLTIMIWWNAVMPIPREAKALLPMTTGVPGWKPGTPD